MRRYGRVDGNQPLIVDCLRRCGCRVEILSSVGGGVPDLLVGTPQGHLILVEVKDPTKPKADQRLTTDQTDWHAEWRRYPIFIVHTVVEALDAIDHECTEFDIHRNGKRSCVACSREL